MTMSPFSTALHDLSDPPQGIPGVSGSLAAGGGGLENHRSKGRGRVVVGMSGGVDSSVTAALLRDQGWEVLGLFMKNWDEEAEPDALREGGEGGSRYAKPSKPCSAADDYRDVARVCDVLGIPYYTMDFSKAYWDQVFQEFLADYKAGWTPNPDILCNREIKFNHLLKAAKELGADYLATGHYCRHMMYGESTDSRTQGLGSEGGEHRLYKGLDPQKDQSYFVYAMGAPALAQTLFPLGGMEKAVVRQWAQHYRLPVAEKKDSTGICFIGERKFRDFLGQYIAAKPGKFMTPDGVVVGEHQGCAFYTLGQRRGLGLGGQGERWFVVAKDPDRNLVYVARGDGHPWLMATRAEATDLSWLVSPETLRRRLQATGGMVWAKSRYRQADQKAKVELLPEGTGLRIEFAEPQRALTPRQALVLYDGEDSQWCLGGGLLKAGLGLPQRS